jgi:hypothetical protein
LSSGKYLYIFYLFIITLFVSSCNLDIYKGFEEPIVTENIFEINDSIIKKDPVKLLIQPSSTVNKVFELMGILTVSFDRLNILFEIPLSSDPSIRPTDFLKSTSYMYKKKGG